MAILCTKVIRTGRLNRSPPPKEAKIASAMQNRAGRSADRACGLRLGPCWLFSAHSLLLLMLVHTASRWRATPAASCFRPAANLTNTSRSARDGAEICARPFTRNSASRCTSKRYRRSTLYRSFSITSSSCAKAQKKLIGEQMTQLEVEKQHSPQEPTVLPLHCVFKVMAVETPPNYFVPVRTPSLLLICVLHARSFLLCVF